MDETWCGSASLNTQVLEQIHLDYINAGAEVITTNTYASSRLMLEAAGLADSFEEINSKAIFAAQQAKCSTAQWIKADFEASVVATEGAIRGSTRVRAREGVLGSA